jgi:hypothetical protein
LPERLPVGEQAINVCRPMAGEIREDAMKLQRREFLHLAAGAACLPTLRRMARAGLPGAAD